MKSTHLRHFIGFLLVATAMVARGQEVKSFSRQMNELKRSGEYVYAEALASTEQEARSACDGLLKIEITKHLASAGGDSDARIVKDISAYGPQYLVQPRGEMMRVFGYVAKSCLEQNSTATPAPATTPAPEPAPEPTPQPEPAPAPQPDPEPQAAPAPQPAPQPVPAPSAGSLHAGELQLAKWQMNMLERLAGVGGVAEAKKLLYTYKNQNRIKRLGDNMAANTRPTDSFYLVFGGDGRPEALLAPSATGVHHDMISGTDKGMDTYSGKTLLWFQISK